MVDSIPTIQAVDQYAECLLSELDQLSFGKRKAASQGNSQATTQARVKKLEEKPGGEDKEKRPKGRLQEEWESKRSPCKFFLTDGGCRRGRNCPYGHVPDKEKRCWHCGCKDHLAPQCTRQEDGKARAAKASTKPSSERERTASAGSKEESIGKGETQVDEQEVAAEDTMKVLLSEATRMLKTMEGSEASEKRAQVRSREPSMVDLQRQLDTLKASMKPFRLSKLCEVNSLGLLDSGATHPLRARRNLGNHSYTFLAYIPLTYTKKKRILHLRFPRPFGISTAIPFFHLGRAQ